MVSLAFTTDSSGGSTVTSTFAINGGYAQTRTRTLPAGYGTYDASDWDPAGRVNVFPAMDVTMVRQATPGNIFYLSIYNEVLLHDFMASCLVAG